MMLLKIIYMKNLSLQEWKYNDLKIFLFLKAKYINYSKFCSLALINLQYFITFLCKQCLNAFSGLNIRSYHLSFKRE